MIRRLLLEGDATGRGRRHGEEHAPGIREYTDERVSLVAGGMWSGGAASHDHVLEIADSMVPAHEAYAPTLAEEMLAMATAAGITPAEAVIVGGFTDFVDTIRAELGAAPEEDTCTAVIVPGEATPDGTGLYGQTWDMHDTATQHIVLLDIRPDSDPAALVFTTVGCVGQMGMNEAGICIGINNLTAAKGTRGVTWPFVVRKALMQTTLDAAVACVLDAELAGAHNFMLVDGGGRGVNIEAMPQGASITEVTGRPFIHTNHVIDAANLAHQAPRDAGLMANSVERLERARELIGERTVDPAALMELTRDEEAICQVATPPFDIESCGATVMRPATGDFWAVWGRPAENEYEHFLVGAS
jgi:isopenicillin-N N-acyltransferase-like protein